EVLIADGGELQKAARTELVGGDTVAALALADAQRIFHFAPQVAAAIDRQDERVAVGAGVPGALDGQAVRTRHLIAEQQGVFLVGLGVMEKEVRRVRPVVRDEPQRRLLLLAAWALD